MQFSFNNNFKNDWPKQFLNSKFFLVLMVFVFGLTLMTQTVVKAYTPYYSVSDIMVGIEGGSGLGGAGGGGLVTVGGYTFDPVAAAIALMMGMWDDPNLINALKAYAITSPNSFNSTEPQMFLDYLENVGNANGINNVQQSADTIVEKAFGEDALNAVKSRLDNATTIKNPEGYTVSQLFQDAYDAASAQLAYAKGNQASLNDWLQNAKEGDINGDFGLAMGKNGTVYYASDANKDGKLEQSALQAVDMTKYVKSGATDGTYSWEGTSYGTTGTTKTTVSGTSGTSMPTTSGGASIDQAAWNNLSADQKKVASDFISSHPGAGLDSEGYLYWKTNGQTYAMGGPGGDTALTVANEKLHPERYGITTSDPNKTACEEAFGADSWLSDGETSTGTGHTAGGGGEGGGGEGEGGEGGGGEGGGGEGGGGEGGGGEGGGGEGGGGGTVTKVSPEITNTTGSSQTKSTFNLTVTTNRSAGCQYKQGSTFTYGSGLTFDTTGGTSHSVKLYSLTTGNYNYYVVCKDTATGGVSDALTVAINVDLSLDENNKPVISNNTNATLTSATSTLAVNTDRPSKCEYKQTNSFTFGSGTAFATTGSYNHNTNLTGLTNGSYVYYAVCQDTTTKAVSAAFKITFTVDLSADTGNVPQVSNVTASMQTQAAPVLAVTTNLPSTCRYSTTSGFSFAAGSLLSTSDSYGHNASIAALTDATYTFYVVCKSNAISTSSAQLTVTTTIDRPDSANNQPKITINTAAYQTSSPATVSITTTKAATCQYGTSSFTWGSGTAFATTGSTTHSVTFSGLENGQHSYYVVCKDSASGEYNSTATQIIFTLNVNSGAGACATLDSNDRQSDSERSSSGSGKNDSAYLWQAVEKGTREKFDKVDWFAGYQFSLSEDGTASELCGYFTKGEANDIYLYNGSYKELAKAKVTGTGDWECVDIDTVNLTADTRYYVITRVSGQSIYYEYKSGFLPTDTGKAVIEAGIRQTVNSTFNKDVIKYDYMIFGLVDVKVSYASGSNEGPEITSTSPSGTISSANAFLSIDTDKGATCKFGRDDVDFEDMKYDIPEVNNGTFSQLVCNLDEGDFTFYVRCKKGEEVNDASKPVEFTVSK